jgi:hypothetical protein
VLANINNKCDTGVVWIVQNLIRKLTYVGGLVASCYQDFDLRPVVRVSLRRTVCAAAQAARHGLSVCCGLIPHANVDALLRPHRNLDSPGQHDAKKVNALGSDLSSVCQVHRGRAIQVGTSYVTTVVSVVQSMRATFLSHRRATP